MPTRMLEAEGPRGLPLAAAILLSAVFTAEARSEERALMLLSAQDSEREQRFLSDLKMALDDIAIVAFLPPEGFFDRPRAEQFELVKPLLRAREALAALWLEGQNGIILHVVVQSDGRILTRQVESRPGFEKDLAISAREVLRTALLFHQGEPAAPPEDVRRWALMAAGGVQVGLLGQVGPATLAGPELAAERHIAEGLWVRLVLQCMFGPVGSDNPIDVRWTLAPAFAAVYLFELGRLTLGPTASLRVGWSHLRILQSGDAHEYSHFDLDLGTGVSLRCPLGPLVVTFALEVFLPVFQQRYELASSGKVVYTTPELRLGGSLGIGWLL